jgi:hypothetical protein
MGPACELSHPPHAGQPRPRCHRILLHPASLHRPAPRLEWPPSRLNSPCHQGPSLTPLNLTPSSMALKPLTPPVTTPTTLHDAPSTPIKGDEHHWPSPPLFPLSPELTHAFLHPRIKLKPPPFFTSVGPPLRHRLCSGEHPSGTASSSSSSSTAAGEHRQALAPAHRMLAMHRRALLSAPPRSMMESSHVARSTCRGPGPLDFPLENKSKKSKIPYHFLFRPLSFL